MIKHHLSELNNFVENISPGMTVTQHEASCYCVAHQQHHLHTSCAVAYAKRFQAVHALSAMLKLALISTLQAFDPPVSTKKHRIVSEGLFRSAGMEQSRARLH